MNNDIFTLDDNNNAAVRTVSVKAGASETNSPVIFTKDENGNACVRVTGAGGGGSVSSVNGKTGIVVLDASDVGAEVETTLTTISTATVTQELATSTIYDCGEMTSITLTLPATIDAKFISQFNFTSGTTPTSITAPNTVVWPGNDITGGVFVPVASKRYCILFFYDGTAVRGLVQGA